MNKKLHLTFLTAAAMLAFTAGASAREIPLKDCPAPVQATIQAQSRSGHLDEIDELKVEGRTIYVAEVDLPEHRDLKIYIRENGDLIKTREDTALKDIPEAVAKTIKSLEGTPDDLEKEIEGGKTTYHVEMDRASAPDLKVVISSEGSILSQTEDRDD